MVVQLISAVMCQSGIPALQRPPALLCTVPPLGFPYVPGIFTGTTAATGTTPHGATIGVSICARHFHRHYSGHRHYSARCHYWGFHMCQTFSQALQRPPALLLTVPLLGFPYVPGIFTGSGQPALLNRRDSGTIAECLNIQITCLVSR